MAAHPRRLVALLAAVAAALAIALMPSATGVRAGGPVRARTAQGVQQSPEPPLAPGRLEPQPAPTPQPPPVPPPEVCPTAVVVGTLCPVDPPAPCVSLRTRVPACVTPGGEIEYRLCVSNDAPATAYKVVVRNPLPPGTRFVRASPEPHVREPELVWRLGALDPCARREITLVLAPTGTGEVRNCAFVQYEHGQCVTTRVGAGAPPAPGASVRAKAPGLSLRKVGPREGRLFEALKFDLFVVNETDAEIRDIVVTDELPPGLELAGGRAPLVERIASLGPRKQRRIEYQAIAKEPGPQTNRATAVAGTYREAASWTVNILADNGTAKLQIQKVGPAESSANLPVRYDITVSNAGDGPAEDVAVTDTLPQGAVFVSASEGGRALGREVQWSLGTLQPGARRNVQVTIRPTVAGELRNGVRASARGGITETAEARTVFKETAGAAGLTYNVVASENPVEVGKEYTYVITVFNQGNAAANNLSATVRLPDWVKPTGMEPLPARQADGAYVFESKSLEGRKAQEYRIRVKAEKPGEARVRVFLRADVIKGPEPLERQESTTIFQDQASRRVPRGVIPVRRVP